MSIFRLEKSIFRSDDRKKKSICFLKKISIKSGKKRSRMGLTLEEIVVRHSKLAEVFALRVHATYIYISQLLRKLGEGSEGHPPPPRRARVRGRPAGRCSPRARRGRLRRFR